MVFKQVTEALRRIHEMQVLHLDIKENNILITFNKDNAKRPECAYLPVEFKIADFGIAKDLQDGQKHQFMKSGTPRYMAPEQLS